MVFAFRKRAGLCLCVFVLTTQHVTAQTVGGAILGVVRDPQGAVVGSTKVTLRNTDTGIARSLLTNDSGSYRATNLQPGPYEAIFESPGFSRGLRKDIVLNVGAEITIDFSLVIGNLAETVEVKAAVDAVDLASSTVNRTVEGAAIRELPLNGRDWTQLATLQPGIASMGRNGGIRSGNGVKLTVSGARPSENNYRLDGISLNDNANNTPGSILGTNLGVEAIREFSVVSNNYSAEYGRASGGVLNAVTRSGTNDLRGTLFYFHRNSAMDARNFFDPSVRPLFRRHQFGAAVGGPIIKNRTFWFANYETVREFLATTSIVNTLSANARAGRLGTGTVTVDPAVAKVLALMPLPNGPLLGNGDTGQFFSQIDKLASGSYFLGKIDHRASDKDSFSGSFFIDRGSADAPDASRTKRTRDESKRAAVTVEWTRMLSPGALNIVRAGFNRNVTNSGNIIKILNPLLEDSSLGFLPGYNIGAISVPGITFPGGGPGSLDVTRIAFNSFQVHENLVLNVGLHSLKLGFTSERMQYNYDLPNLTGGSYSFGTINDFIVNKPVSFGSLYPGSDTVRGLRQTMLAGYVQDDVRLKRNLSLNIGLRYEFLTVPTEVNGKIALLKNLTDPEVRVGGPVHDTNPTRFNFSPRVGLVWDPFGTSKTSIRVSGGIFDSLPLLWIYDTPLSRSMPYFLQGVTTAPPAGSFPSQAYPLLKVTNLRTAYVDTEPKRAYSPKWNFSIQRDLGGWFAEVGYTGSRGIHLPLVERNMNTVQPVETRTGWIIPADGKVLNPNFATINTTNTWNADSSYHGLQTSLKRTLGKAAQMNASYTWSKSIDNGSSTASTAATSGYSTAVGVTSPLFPALNRGLSDFDIRHNFVLSFVWETPTWNVLPALPRNLLRQWQFGAILRTQTGTPFSAVLNNDQAGSKTDTTGASLGQRPNLIVGPGCNTLTRSDPRNYIRTECLAFPAPNVLGNLGRNTLTAPGIQNVDFSLFKNLRFTERLAGQLRLELFNALNHTNFSAPNFVIFDRQGKVTASSGIITSTSTESRRIQLGMKINF
jgi:hypothetical protein